MEEIESEGSDIVSDGDTEADEGNANDNDGIDMDFDYFQGFHGSWTTNHTEFIRHIAVLFNQGACTTSERSKAHTLFQLAMGRFSLDTHC